MFRGLAVSSRAVNSPAQRKVAESGVVLMYRPSPFCAFPVMEVAVTPLWTNLSATSITGNAQNGEGGCGEVGPERRHRAVARQIGAIAASARRGRQIEGDQAVAEHFDRPV